MSHTNICYVPSNHKLRYLKAMKAPYKDCILSYDSTGMQAKLPNKLLLMSMFKYKIRNYDVITGIRVSESAQTSKIGSTLTCELRNPN